MNTDFDELLSITHSKLAEILTKDQSKLDFKQDEERFMDWLYSVVTNSFIDEKRRRSNKFNEQHCRAEDAMMIAEAKRQNRVYQPDFDIVDFAEELKIYVDKAFAYQPAYWKVIWENIFYKQKSYEETVSIVNKPMGTIKACIWKMREVVKAEFGNKYDYLMNKHS